MVTLLHVILKKSQIFTRLHKVTEDRKEKARIISLWNGLYFLSLLYQSWLLNK